MDYEWERPQLLYSSFRPLTTVGTCCAHKHTISVTASPLLQALDVHDTQERVRYVFGAISLSPADEGLQIVFNEFDSGVLIIFRIR